MTWLRSLLNPAVWRDAEDVDVLAQDADQLGRDWHLPCLGGGAVLEAALPVR